MPPRGGPGPLTGNENSHRLLQSAIGQVRVTSPAGRALPREPVHPGGPAEMLATDLSALGLADVPDALAGLVPGAGFAVRYLLVVGEPVVTTANCVVSWSLPTDTHPVSAATS